MEQLELIPFRRAIEAGVPAIMMSHVLFPNIEPEQVPCTMSRRMVTGLLKQKLGFRGLILTDCMEMGSHPGLLRNAGRRGRVHQSRCGFGGDIQCL